MPTLAICRGFQLLNVLRGGDLVQHLPEDVGHEGHRETLGVFSAAPGRGEGGNALETILGPRHDSVRSSHHQGVGRVGTGLVESASPRTVRSRGSRIRPSSSLSVCSGIPEMEEDDKRLFEALVAEARTYRTAR